MEISDVKEFLSACQEAKRITELMPPLPKGMSPRHIYVIDAVFQLSQCQEQVMVSDVSKLLGVTRPSITKVIQELEKLKVLTKIPDQEDKRIVHIALTPLGKEYYNFYVGGYHSWLAGNFREISPEDLTVTADTIRRVLKIMNELDIHTYEMERKDEEKNEGIRKEN